jgi:hypothetical protein
MTDTPFQHIARQYLESHYEDAWLPGEDDEEAYEALVRDLAAEFVAAIVDRWIEWRETKRKEAATCSST